MTVTHNYETEDSSETYSKRIPENTSRVIPASKSRFSDRVTYLSAFEAEEVEVCDDGTFDFPANEETKTKFYKY